MTTEYTTDEVRELFLDHVRYLVDYWATVKPVMGGKPSYSCYDRVSGVAFSMLVLLDGGSASFPGFIVAPDPHPDDKDFLKSLEQRWFPENDEANVNCDIAGYLHELFHKREEVE